MRIWVAENVLRSGSILQCEAEIRDREAWVQATRHPSGGYQVYHELGRDYHLSLADAEARAQVLIRRRIAELKDAGSSIVDRIVALQNLKPIVKVRNER